MWNYEYSPQYIALAQLRNALNKIRVIKEKKLLLDRLVNVGLDVNYAVPSDAPVVQHSPELVGWTALHFAISTQDFDVISYIVQLGAKVTAVNGCGVSPIRLALEYHPIISGVKHCQHSLERKGLLKHPVVESLLRAQYAQKDPSNPSCQQGLSHLHAACMVNDARMVEYLLLGGASPELAVSADSPRLAGYRPAHVAVRYGALDSLEVLLASGAEISAREARGLTSLQLLMECHLELMELLREADTEEKLAVLRRHGERYEAMGKWLLARCAANGVSLRDEHGLERLHVAACFNAAMLREALQADPGVNVNATVSGDEALWPGYTPLHFAARCDLGVIETLTERGGCLDRSDARGITPFDLCINRYAHESLSKILSLDQTLKDKWIDTQINIFQNITMESHPLVTLCDAVKALRSVAALTEFLRNLNISVNDPVSMDSPLWPGYTLLHLFIVLLPPYKLVVYRNNLSQEFDVQRSPDICPSAKVELTGVTMEYYESRCNDYRKQLIKLRTSGANPFAKDAQNLRPIDLGLRRGLPYQILSILVEWWVGQLNIEMANASDLDGSIFLHLCSVGRSDALEAALLQRNVDVNVRTTSEIRIYYDQYATNITNITMEEYCFSAGSTPLHFAVATKSSNIQYLIEKGADPLAIDADGRTPIHLAFITDRSNYLMKFVIKHLIPPSTLVKLTAMSSDRLSHFHVLCWADNVQAVESCVSQVDINAKINCDQNDTDAACLGALQSAACDAISPGEKETLLLAALAGYTPLHIAVENQSVEMTRLLVEQGADVNARNARGMSPLHMALTIGAFSKRILILEVLMSGVNYSRVNVPLDDYGITPLHVAARKLDKDFLLQLLNDGWDVDAQIHMDSPLWPGDTPLHLFFSNDMCTDAVELLFRRGADISLPNKKSETPLHVIAFQNHERLDRVIKLLLRNKKNKLKNNRTNMGGLSILHIACMSNDMEVVNELCTQEANVNQTTDYFGEHGGRSPLHFAAMASNPSVVKFLIERGAKVSAVDSHGRVPLHAFCEYHQTTCNSQENIIPMLINSGSNVNVQDTCGMTPLEIILLDCSWRETKLTMLLIFGARLNIVNPLSRRPLLSTALLKHVNLLALLSRTSDTDILTVMDDGSTAIHNLVCYFVYSDTSIEHRVSLCRVIEALVKKGCYINAQDNQGNTALHVAIEHNNFAAVSALLDNGINVNIAYFQIPSISNGRIKRLLSLHLHKLRELGLAVCSSTDSRLCVLSNEANHIRKKLKYEIRALDKVKLHGNFTLRQFMTERAIMEYMPRARRDAIVERLASCELYEKFLTLEAPMRYQYRRLLERIDLVEPSKRILRLIMHNRIPELCFEKIIAFLGNEDLKVLIALTRPPKRKATNDDPAKKKIKIANEES